MQAHPPWTAREFERLLRPRAVAIVGATADTSRIGGQPLRGLTGFGFQGAVYPVNPKHETLRGIRCYPDIAAVPQPCDLAIVAVPAQHVAGIIEDCGAAGIRLALVLSSGFRETGEAGTALQEDLVARARRAGVRVIGPNCQGFMNVATRMYGGFGTAFANPALRAGPVAMVTQSGGFGFGVVTEVAAARMGFNYIASTGNESDVSALELLEFLLEQPDVEVLTTYLEGVKDGRRLLALGERALELGKPILAWKVGNTGSGRRAAISHTANLTSGPEIYRAAFRQGGFIEVRDSSDLMNAARAFLAKQRPRGRNVAVLTSSGGLGVLLADRCEERGLRLPELAAPTRASLAPLLPPYAALGNPVDVTGQMRGDAEGMNHAISALLDAPEIDQLIVRKGSTVGRLGTEWAGSLVPIADAATKPILVSMLTDRSEDTIEILDRHRIAWFPAPEGCAFAAAALCDFTEKRLRHRQREPRGMERRPIEWEPGSAVLAEHAAQRVLSAYGIEAVRSLRLTEPQVTTLNECPLAFPVAVKIDSADIAHKTEAGGVKLRIGNLADLKAAAAEVLRSARACAPGARIDGVLVQEMATGVEMMLGAVNDECFGPVVALGLGGIFAEALQDVTHRCAPFDAATARTMIGELKGRRVLDGMRGQPPADVESLALAVSRFSLLAADHADRIREIDVNPLFVRPRGVVAADALIVLKSRVAGPG